MTVRRARLARLAVPAAVMAGATGLVLAGAAPPAGAAPHHTGAPAVHQIKKRHGGRITFGCTGGSQFFRVPFGVKFVTIRAFGADGADGSTGSGGNGDGVSSKVHVFPGQVLTVTVGCVGTNSGGGFPDGGAPGASDAGGGGGSSFVTGSGHRHRHGTGPGPGPLLVAGAGGGAGGDAVCTTNSGAGGDGGNAGNDGSPGDGGCLLNSPLTGGGGGGGATFTAGGDGGAGGSPNGTPGMDGTAVGGTGGLNLTAAGDGGGGGGGWFGGGGGGSGADNAPDFSAGGGGGGGSSAVFFGRDRHYKLPRSHARHNGNFMQGNGQVTITWFAPPPPPPPPPPPHRHADLGIRLTHLGIFQSGRLGGYRLRVVNTGSAPTFGPITATLRVPRGEALVQSGGGLFWRCAAVRHFLRCTRFVSLLPHRHTVISASVLITARPGRVLRAVAHVRPLDRTPFDNTSVDFAQVFR